VHLAARIETGGWALIGAAFLSMVTRASLNRRAIWQAIAPPAPPPSGPVIACLSCDLVCSADHDGGRCPRCGRPLHVRTPGAIPAAAALVCAGYLLYPVANYFPMSLDYRIDQVQAHTIANGVEQLLAAGFWPIALLIFTTSIAIPLLKLVGLTWLLWSAHRGSTHRLVLKTRLYRVIDEIGRWSNVDIFTIAIFMPLMQFDGLVQVRAAVGAPAFLAVVLLTMLAVRWFDPRLLWDKARA
jgi:paraquat-inducible protein A